MHRPLDSQEKIDTKVSKPAFLARTNALSHTEHCVFHSWCCSEVREWVSSCPYPLIRKLQQLKRMLVAVASKQMVRDSTQSFVSRMTPRLMAGSHVL